MSKFTSFKNCLLWVNSSCINFKLLFYRVSLHFTFCLLKILKNPIFNIKKSNYSYNSFYSTNQITNTLFFFFCFILFLYTLEHGLHSTLSHPPIINNNNSTINNNNHSTKSGTNPAKLASVATAAATVAAATAAPSVNDDHHHHHHQPIIASIHRNGRVSEAASAANKAVAIPKVKSKSKSKTKSIDKTLTNGDLTGNFIEFSIVDSIDGNQSSGDQSALLSLASPIPDKIVRNLQQNQHQQLQTPTPADLNVIQANKTIVAMSILIQHLTTDVSVAACARVCL